jgi:hypothetical protein
MFPPFFITTAEKDEDTTLSILGNSSDFVAVYGRPLYMIENMSGKPASLLRLSYSDVETDTDGVNDNNFNDDFFQHNSNSSGFQQLLKNYTFVLHYTGLRWHGKLLKLDATIQFTMSQLFLHSIFLCRRSIPARGTL